MATLKPGRFNEYDLTDEELRISVWNDYQIARIHNERKMVADALLEIKLDPEKLMEYMQHQAFLKGKLAMLDELLAIEAEVRQMTYPQSLTESENPST